MLIPEKFIRKLEKFPQIAKLLFEQPIAFFGEVVKYPKQAMIINRWLKEQPKIMVITGWKRTAKCVAKDTRISGQRIDSFGFKKGTAQLYRVGDSLRATSEHVVLSPTKGWISVGSCLSQETPLFFECPLVSTGELCLSEFLGGGLSSWKTVSSFQSDYLRYFHLHGGQPQSEVIYGPDGLPSPNDAQMRAYEGYLNKQKCSPLSQPLDPLSTWDDLHPLHHLFSVEDLENERVGAGSSPHIRAYKLSALPEALRTKVLSGVDRPKLSSDSLVYLLLWLESKVYTIAVAVNAPITLDVEDEYWDAPVPSIHAYEAGGFINHNTSVGSYLGACWMLGQLNHLWPGAQTMGIEQTYRWNKRFSGQRAGVIGGRNLDHVDSVLLRQYRDLIPPAFVKSWFSRNTHSVNLMDGSRFVVRSYDQGVEPWKSASSQFTHLDEEPPLEILMECLERSRTVKGKIIITVALDDADISYLPDACENPKKHFGTDSFLHFKLGVEDVPDDIYPPSEKIIVYNQYDGTNLEGAVRRGEFSFVSGKWWGEFDKQIHVIKDFPIPDNWPKWRAVDPGTAAPCACIWAAMHPVHQIIFFYRQYYKKGTTFAERCSDIIELSGNTRQKDGGIFTEMQTKEKYELTLMDHAEFKSNETTGEGTDYEYIRNGLDVQAWSRMGQEGRRDMMRKWLWIDKREKHFITHLPGAPRAYFFESCEDLIWEAGKKSFKRAASERAGTSERKVQEKDDHLMDCAEALAVELSWAVAARDVV